MRFGVNPFGAVPIGGSDLDASVAAVYTDLIANQELPRAYLFHAQPYDPSTSSVVDVYASLGISEPILDPGTGAVAWPARLAHASDVQTELFSGTLEDAQGRTSFGNLELLLGDGEYSAWRGYYWDGRDFEVLIGQDGWDYADFRQVYAGTVEDLIWDRNIRLVTRGKEQLLESELSYDTYLGNGGLEGSEELYGVQKPLAFGFLINITPVLVDEDNLIYQFHDGAALEVNGAYDGGFALINDGDVANSIETATVAPGYYKTQLSDGYIKLGAVPEKQLTLDVEGSTYLGYSARIAGIVKRLLLGWTELETADLDLGSFETALLDSSRANGGIYITDSMSGAEALTQLMDSIGGSWVFSREGKLSIHVMRTRYSSGTVTDTDIVRQSYRRERTKPPSWHRTLGYRKSWTVHTESDYVGAATQYRRNLTMREYRSVINRRDAVKVTHKGARKVRKDTLLATLDDTVTEVLRQQEIFAYATNHVSFAARRQQFKYNVGDTITVVHTGYGINADGVILSLREDTRTQTTTFNVLLITDNTERYVAVGQASGSAQLSPVTASASVTLGSFAILTEHDAPLQTEDGLDLWIE